MARHIRLSSGTPKVVTFQRPCRRTICSRRALATATVAGAELRVSQLCAAASRSESGSMEQPAASSMSVSRNAASRSSRHSTGRPECRPTILLPRTAANGSAGPARIRSVLSGDSTIASMRVRPARYRSSAGMVGSETWILAVRFGVKAPAHPDRSTVHGLCGKNVLMTITYHD